MDLEKHIKENHNGNVSAFARWLTEKSPKIIRRQQVERWIKDGCHWRDGDVWARKTKLTQKSGDDFGDTGL